MSGSKLIPKYQAYLSKPSIPKNESLRNIERFLSCLSFYSAYSNKKKRVANHNSADDPDIFDLWQSELIQLCNSNNIDSTGVFVLKHVIDCCLNKIITPLPKEVSESIMSTKDRQEAANQAYYNRLDDVMVMQHQTHHVSALSKKIIEDVERRGYNVTQFSSESFLKYNNNDLATIMEKTANNIPIMLKVDITNEACEKISSYSQ